jgi:hypothetical protein
VINAQQHSISTEELNIAYEQENSINFTDTGAQYGTATAAQDRSVVHQHSIAQAEQYFY